MWRLKDCPRCRRDVFIYQSINGNQYAECFRCGYRTQLVRIVEVREKVSKDNLKQTLEAPESVSERKITEKR